MKNWWKWAGLSALIVVVGVGVLSYAALSRYNLDSLKPMLIKAVKEATGRNLTLGQVGFKIGFRPVLVVDDVRFQNPAWASRPDLVRIQHLEVQVALLPLFRKKVELKRLIIIEPDLQVECDKAGKSNLEFDGLKTETKDEVPARGEMTLPGFAFQEMVLERGRLEVKDGGTDSCFSVRVEHLRAVSKTSDGAILMKFAGTYQEKPFEADVATGSLEELIKKVKPWPVHGTVQLLGAQIRTEGSVKEIARGEGFTFSFKAEGKSSGEIARFLDLGELPDVGPFLLSGNVSDVGALIYRFSDLKARLKGGEVSGSLDLDVAGKRPKVTGSLACQSMDLRAFFPKQESSERSKRDDRVFSDQPIQLQIPSDVDVDLRIRALKLTTPYASLKDIQVDLALKQGKISLKPLKAFLGGGLVEGHAGIRSEGKNVAVAGAFKVEKLDLQAMLKDVGTKEVMEGTVSAEIEFSSSGDSMASLMGGMNGKSVVWMGNGKIVDQYIELLGADLSSSLFRLLRPSDNSASYTEIQCAVSGLDIKEGLARVTALVADTPQTSVRGSGEIDLKTEELNLSIEPMPKKGLAGLSLSFAELAKPFRLVGTLAHPSLSIDPTQTALTLGKALGGIALFGPFGLAGALTGKTSEENACATALEEARRGGQPAHPGRKEEKRVTSEGSSLPQRDVYSGP